MQNSSENSSYEAYVRNLDNQITYYYVFVSSAIGIPGNLISMVIFIRLMIKNTKINMGFLYTFQTTIDFVMLVFTLFAFRGSPYLFGYLVTNLNDTYCRVFMFLRRFMLHASSWISVFISFDRFTFVLYKSRFKFMKNKLTLSAIIFGVMILLAISDVANLFYYIGGKSRTSLLFTCIASNEVTLISDMMSIAIRVYIPLLLIAIFDSLITYRLYRSSRCSKIIQTSSRIRRKENQFTFAVMSCNVLFFILNSPLAIFYILYDVNFYSGAFKSNPTFSALYNLYLNVFVDMYYIFQTCSIFIYLAFNKLFRKELFIFVIELLPCKVFRSNFNSNDVETSLSRK